ncbi:MAG: hypothetical protein IJ696_00775 [Ruminococcus sp.]|nr:hypothetical protein [Ruminococcus sp.]
MKRQIVSGVLALSMMLGTSGFVPTVYAQSNNNSFKTAQSISTGAVINDNLNKAGDQNYYKFTLSADGYLNISFKKGFEEYDPGKGWTVYVYDSAQHSIFSEYFYVGDPDTEHLTPLGLNAGTYYVKVSGATYTSLMDYEITVDFTPSQQWDNGRADDTFLTANKIVTDETYYGTLTSTSDTDYFKFTAPDDGYVEINFNSEYEEYDPGKGYVISLYDEKQKYIYSTYVYVGDEETFKTPRFGVVKNAGYFIKIAEASYLTKKTYNLNVNFIKSDFRESGRGKDFLSADSVGLYDWYYGSTHNASNADYYEFYNNNEGSVPFDFGSVYEEYYAGKGWIVSFYDEKHKFISSNSYVVGEKNYNASLVSLPKGKVFIKVSSNTYHSTVDYYFRLGVKSVKNAKVTAVGNKTYTGKAIKPSPAVKVDGVKLEKGTDYTISYSDNKQIGTAKITITGKGRYKGSKTVTFKIIPKKTKVTSLTSPKVKKLKVKYKKVAGVTGYQIKYSTSKKFTKKTTGTVTVKGAGKLSKTIGKLKKGKTYYVKVRTYKTVKGTKYYSGYTAVKKVKIKKK